MGFTFPLIRGKFWEMGRRISEASDVQKTAEPIEFPFGMMSGVGPSNRELDGRAHFAPPGVYG